MDCILTSINIRNFCDILAPHSITPHSYFHSHLSGPPVSHPFPFQSLRRSLEIVVYPFLQPSFNHPLISKPSTRQDGIRGARRQERCQCRCAGKESQSTESSKVSKRRSCSRSFWKTTAVPSWSSCPSLFIHFHSQRQLNSSAFPSKTS